MALVDQYAGVIFDYGGVLVAHQSAQDVAYLAELAGLSPEAFHQVYWSDRLAYDKGLVSADEYWNDMARRAGTIFTAEQIQKLVDADVESWLKFDASMYTFAKALREQGKRVAVLSNMPLELGEALKSRTQGFEPFAHLTLSYEVHSVKPEPEIYEHCLAGIGLEPEEALFLDDRIENVRGAQRLGIHALQFTSPAEMLPKLNHFSS
jgi:putative hydrolase of the HAD superfamily